MTMDTHPETRAALGTLQMVSALAALARQIVLQDVEDILREYDYSHSVMPILDPTRYMRMMGSEVVEQNVALLSAYVAFRRAIDKPKSNGD